MLNKIARTVVAVVAAGLTVLASSPAASATELSALQRLARLVARNGPGATSVAALDLRTGLALSRGAPDGMVSASIAKLLIIEELLLVKQRHHAELNAAESVLAVDMIEHSDNNAADDLYQEIGDDRFRTLEIPLRLAPAVLVPDPGGMWGLTTTSAAQELTLLQDLTDSHSPLTLQHRGYVLDLMRHVESDQRWGVSAASDAGTSVALKNGWLGVDDDGGLWAVNSIGEVTIGGHRVLLAILTQHLTGYDAGVRRVEALAQAMATVLRG